MSLVENLGTIQGHLETHGIRRALEDVFNCPDFSGRCRICNRSFGSVQELIEFHKPFAKNNECCCCSCKPFPFELGTNSDKRKSCSMVVHLRCMHPYSSFPEQCNLCRLSFPNTEVLADHVNRHHRKLDAKHFFCQICCTVIDKSRHKYHTYAHETPCPACDVVLRGRFEYDRHVRHVHQFRTISSFHRIVFVCSLEACDLKFDSLPLLVQHINSEHKELPKVVR
jgi:hypothetical protein